jgi:hypothetical protein
MTIRTREDTTTLLQHRLTLLAFLGACLQIAFTSLLMLGWLLTNLYRSVVGGALMPLPDEMGPMLGLSFGLLLAMAIYLWMAIHDET